MAATIYARAKAELQRRGWHQGDFVADWDETEACAVCLTGALYAACHGHPHAVDLDHPVCDGWAAIRKVGDHLHAYASDWNDAVATSVDEVYALLDEMDRLEREAARP